MEKGKLNRITDVEGVLVGHKTISSGTHQTGLFVRLKMYFIKSWLVVVVF